MSATVGTTHSQLSAKRTSSVPRKPINWWRIVSYLILALFAVIYLGPLLMLVNTALKTLPEFMKNAVALPTSFQFQNFIDAWNKANFSQYLLNSIL